ncbi:methyl-accepting chemotaxis protein [Prochlorothrix hollandica]|uniref:Chemotaxis protein n=1 Tax=Prochlorothrix hollandica PCC 9006 = CALU 1027 TaxID=317619 RepID=A0A0M2PPH9_PROHO|nr:methyl-accepting chemotaxis protein [Prochlorothrix hollandica]KKI98480.1 hypothetical protein PROH_18850 [Prochlorothrix hollandica PCC 9006 = CALU 1027]
MSYKQAYYHYQNQEYAEAAAIIDSLVHEKPDDTNARLLRGHIYSGLQQYDVALSEYENLQVISDDPTVLQYAEQGIANCHAYLEINHSYSNGNGNGHYGGDAVTEATMEPSVAFDNEEPPDLGLWQDSPEGNGEQWQDDFGAGLDLEESDLGADSFENLTWDDTPIADDFDDQGLGAQGEEEAVSGPFGTANGVVSSDLTAGNPFASDNLDSNTLDDLDNLGSINFGQPNFTSYDAAGADLEDDNDPFFIPNADPVTDPGLFGENLSPLDRTPDLDLDGEPTIALGRSSSFGDLENDAFSAPALDVDDFESTDFESTDFESTDFQSTDFQSTDFESTDFESTDFESTDFESTDFESTDFESTGLSYGNSQSPQTPLFANNLDGDQPDTFFMGAEPNDPPDTAEHDQFDFRGDDTFADASSSSNFSDEDSQTLFMGGMGSDDDEDFSPTTPELESDFSPPSFNDLGSEDFGLDQPSTHPSLNSDSDFGYQTNQSRKFNAAASSQGNSSLDDFGDFGEFSNFDDFDVSEDLGDFSSSKPGSFDSPSSGSSSGSEVVGFNDPINSNLSGDTLWGDDSIPSFTQTDMGAVEPVVSVEQDSLAFLENSDLSTKRLIVAGCTGVIAAFASLAVYATRANAPEVRNNPPVAEQVQKTAIGMALLGLVGGIGSNFLLGEIIVRQSRKSINDLQQQMQRVTKGDFSAQTTVYSEDELGQLSASFNQMSRVILTTTKEAQRKADEQEQQREDLQRQVIRLLDDVEGAARGDLTVQAEVTADVLGAVADSFNLTIQNLREIVHQVKTAALQVNKSASDNETFARSLSSDALRQAEELAVTLNSVQVMTDSIQRVAESAREAEEVARTASSTALRGGEAVEQTVAGILRIRETVAETTRKVKRLAESSQEISKIVALIAAIASRTNLLALNASIEAARAGEAGRGFAIVADEVRQLADRAAKASKEIEQIVLQIQSETGSVMTAMEEGTQQVIEGTKLAEQAKRSLEDIIQVSNRIDQLVRSITADTVEQTETSRAVAQVMQSVELTAQETSQEAQRVSRSLQNLVGIARDLQTSVERFRVETTAE